MKLFRNLLLCLLVLVIFSACKETAAPTVVQTNTYTQEPTKTKKVSPTVTTTPDPSKTPASTRIDIRVTSTSTEPVEPDFDFSGELIQLIYLYDQSLELPGISAEDPYPALVQAIEKVNSGDGLYGAEIVLTAVEISESAVNAKAQLIELLENNQLAMVLLPEELPNPDFTQYLTINNVPALILQPRSSIPEGFYALNPSLDTLFEAALIFLNKEWDELGFYRHAEGINVSFISWKMYEGRKPIIPQGVLDFLRENEPTLVLRDGIFPEEITVTANALLQSQINGANVLIVNTAGYGLANILNDLNNLGLRQDFLVVALQAGKSMDFERYLAVEEYMDNLLVLASINAHENQAPSTLLNTQIDIFMQEFWLEALIESTISSSSSENLVLSQLNSFTSEILNIGYAQFPVPQNIQVYLVTDGNLIHLDEFPLP